MGVYSFGSPRVGNGRWRDRYNILVPNSWRVTHYKDPAPHLPVQRPWPFWYSGFLHTNSEIHYNEASTAFLHCSSEGHGSSTCADQYDIGQCVNHFSDHMHSLNINMDPDTNGGCSIQSDVFV